MFPPVSPNRVDLLPCAGVMVGFSSKWSSAMPQIAQILLYTGHLIMGIEVQEWQSPT